MSDESDFELGIIKRQREIIERQRQELDRLLGVIGMVQSIALAYWRDGLDRGIRSALEDLFKVYQEVSSASTMTGTDES